MSFQKEKSRGPSSKISFGIFIISLFVLFLSVTYAFVSMRVVGEKKAGYNKWNSIVRTI